jgi:hypothetical protein
MSEFRQYKGRLATSFPLLRISKLILGFFDNTFVTKLNQIRYWYFICGPELYYSSIMRALIFALGTVISAFPVSRDLTSIERLEICDINVIQGSHIYENIKRENMQPPLTGPPGKKITKIDLGKSKTPDPDTVSGYAVGTPKKGSGGLPLSQRQKSKSRKRSPGTESDIERKQKVENWVPYFQPTDAPDDDTTDAERAGGCVENVLGEPHDIEGDETDMLVGDGVSPRGEGGALSCMDTTEGEIFAQEYDSDGNMRPEQWQLGMDDPNSSASDLENPDGPSSGSDSDWLGLPHWNNTVYLERPHRPTPKKRQTLSKFSSDVLTICYLTAAQKFQC